MKNIEKLGGNPDNDIACIYLSKLFLSEEESRQILEDYKKGNLLSSDVKRIFADEVVAFTKSFQANLKKTKKSEVEKHLLRNKN